MYFVPLSAAIELLQGAKATTTTQDQIEMLCFSVHQTQASINKLAGITHHIAILLVCVFHCS